MTGLVELVAIALYEQDCMMLAIYPTGEASWPHDRESIRERYRAKARDAIAAMPGTPVGPCVRVEP